MARSRVAFSQISGDIPHQDNPSPYKAGHIRLNRVSIGEGIPESRFESHNGYDDVDQYLTYDDVMRLQGTDMERYRHVHHPHSPERQGYHWTHLRSQQNAAGVRAVTHGGSREIYAGYAEKIPGSREIKKRMNFSYPSYDIVVDGASQMASLEEKVDGSKNAVKVEQKQESKFAFFSISPIFMRFHRYVTTILKLEVSILGSRTVLD